MLPIPSLPALHTLARLAHLLRVDDYAAVQFVPHADHDAAYLRDNLSSLVAQEGELLSAKQQRHPVMYARSICSAHYAAGLSARQGLLARIFLHNQSVPVSEVRALAAPYLELLDGTPDDRVAWPLRIVPVYDLLLLADPLAAMADDRVFLHHDSTRMARVLWGADAGARIKGSCVADIGTGSGILAAVAARCGAKRVIGVDINQRALDFARANGAINEGLNIDLRLGSIEVAVAEADLLLSNPPYMRGRAGQCLDGRGPDGLDIPRHFVAVAAKAGKPLWMVLELETALATAVIERLGAPGAHVQVLRRLADRELLLYRLDGAGRSSHQA